MGDTPDHAKGRVGRTIGQTPRPWMAVVCLLGWSLGTFLDPASAAVVAQWSADADTNADTTWDDAFAVNDLTFASDYDGNPTITPVKHTGITGYSFTSAFSFGDLNGADPNDPLLAMKSGAYFQSLDVLSLDLWFRPDTMDQMTATDTSGNPGRGVLFSTGGTALGMSLSMENNALRFLLKTTSVGGDNSQVNLTASLTGFTTADFIRATVTVDGPNNVVRLYVDGALMASQSSVAFGDFTGNSNTAIGGPFYNGSIYVVGGADQTSDADNTDFLNDYRGFVGDIALVTVYDNIIDVVPEPATIVLIVLGGGLALSNRRRRQAG